jgi:hypothetical protein
MLLVQTSKVCVGRKNRGNYYFKHLLKYDRKRSVVECPRMIIESMSTDFYDNTFGIVTSSRVVIGVGTIVIHIKMVTSNICIVTRCSVSKANLSGGCIAIDLKLTELIAAVDEPVNQGHSVLIQLANVEHASAGHRRRDPVDNLVHVDATDP